MKILLVGKHASGKTDVLNILQGYGLKTGREFCNIPNPVPQLYIDPQYERYSIDDIDKIFENNSYICISGVDEAKITDSYTYYRGISLYTFDNSEVMAIRPSQVVAMNKRAVNDEIVFVWMDNTREHRIKKHVADHRTYSFIEQEEIESQFDVDFSNVIYNFPNSSVIYFTNEDPGRVAAVCYALMKHPELKDIFVENYN